MMSSLVKWLGPNKFEVNGIVFSNNEEDGSLHILKFHHMLSMYEELLTRLQPKRIFEIGLFRGASLALFSEMCPGSRIGGIDLSVTFPALESYRQQRPGREIFTAQVNQADGPGLNAFAKEIFGGMSEIDLVIDDGSHLYEPSKVSFETIFPAMRPGAVYVIEDWGWAHWGGVWQERTSQWWDQTPLSLLIFEIIMLSCSRPDLIPSIDIRNDGGSALMFIERGKGEFIGGLKDLVNSRGMTLAFNKAPDSLDIS